MEGRTRVTGENDSAESCGTDWQRSNQTQTILPARRSFRPLRAGGSRLFRSTEPRQCKAPRCSVRGAAASMHGGKSLFDRRNRCLRTWPDRTMIVRSRTLFRLAYLPDASGRARPLGAPSIPDGGRPSPPSNAGHRLANSPLRNWSCLLDLAEWSNKGGARCPERA